MGKEKFVYKHNNKTYQQKINELYDNQFTLLGDYINAKSSVKLLKANTKTLRLLM